MGSIQFVDARPGTRRELPHNPGKSWRTRAVGALKGFAIHHTAGGDDPGRTAAYHVGASHTSGSGMAGLAYTFYITLAGVIWWAWDLDQQTWSQGGGTVPDANGDGKLNKADGLGAANAGYLAIVLGGSFESRWNHTGQQPTFLQLHALQTLIGHLTGACESEILPDDLLGAVDHLSPGDAWPHSAFGKAACPGALTEDQIKIWHTSEGAKKSWTDRDWQQALSDLGYPLGLWGPKGDGVDGSWGGSSKAALVAFQRDQGLPQTGDRDKRTESALF